MAYGLYLSGSVIEEQCKCSVDEEESRHLNPFKSRDKRFYSFLPPEENTTNNMLSLFNGADLVLGSHSTVIDTQFLKDE